MSFAICYSLEDMSKIAATIQANSLSNAIKNEARKYYNAGLNTWDTSPSGQFPWDTGICPECHIVTCTYNTLAGFIQLLRNVAADFQSRGVPTDDTRYMLALADDLSANPIGHNSAGAEPWP